MVIAAGPEKADGVRPAAIFPPGQLADVLLDSISASAAAPRGDAVAERCPEPSGTGHRPTRRHLLEHRFAVGVVLRMYGKTAILCVKLDVEMF